MTYDLNRFIKAQELDYDRALSEICAGRKRSHWIWYIFPQLAQLGYSYNARYYGISGLAEAQAYMKEPILRERLLEITRALLTLPDSDPLAVMGSPDDMKLCSCMTLFAVATPEYPEFQQVLDRYFGGKADHRTVDLLKA